MKYLVTGAAGFIGYHVSQRLLDDGHEVVGVDCLSDYYDPLLKDARVELLLSCPSFEFIKADLADRQSIRDLFEKGKFDRVIHLAAQAGVRYSVENPYAYLESNLAGFLNILEGCRHQKIEHLVFASSSSVYGGNKKIPFSEKDPVDHPVSFYAATKKSNELMAHSYAHLYGIPCTGLRFFTVYGPWGRPDMAYFSFTKSILEGKPIGVFNQGQMKRDFTYIDDVVEGVVRITDKIPTAEDKDSAPFCIYNIGNNQPVALMDFIEILEKSLGKKAEKKMMEMQAGDVVMTYADIDALQHAIGYKPSTPLKEGLKKFVEWYKDFYRIEDAE